MQNLGVVCVIYVRENSKQLSVDMLHGRGKGWREIVTSLSREHGFVVQQVLDPCHHIIDVRWGGKLYALTILIDPGVI